MELTKGKAAVVSLRHNPGHYSHLVGMGKSLLDLGFEVEYVLDSPYRHLPELSAIAPIYSARNCSTSNGYCCAIFVSPSLQNPSIAASFKKHGTRIVYIYHEPWKYSLDYIKGEEFKWWIRAALAHQLSKAMLKMSDVVILPSRYAFQAYSGGDIRYNGNAHVIPLMYPDEVDGTCPCRAARKYFSYIGSISRAHGFDDYVEFMRHALARGLDVNFMIASKFALPRYVLKDKLIQANLEKIHIACGRPLTIPEINQCYSQSFCVWNLYRRSTQSGVLVKAFMFGVPLIASHTGSFPEFVKDGFNGRFVSCGDHSAVEAAVLEIREHLDQYTSNCRKTFLETFYYRANLGGLERLLGDWNLHGPRSLVANRVEERHFEGGFGYE